MSQADIFPTEITTLYTPAWYSDKVREERELPLAPGVMVAGMALSGLAAMSATPARELASATLDR